MDYGGARRVSAFNALFSSAQTEGRSPLHALLFRPQHLLIARTLPDKNLPLYLQTIGGTDYTQSNTVLISRVWGGARKIEQLLIPPALDPPSNPLELQVFCTSGEEGNEAMVYAIWDKYGPVNWRSTFTNVQGSQYFPPPPPVPSHRPSLDDNEVLSDPEEEYAYPSDWE